MKKNFFKKLASGLALAMVVTSFAPAAPALAATATKIVKQGGAKAPTTVYVGKKVDYSLNKVYGTNTYKWFTSNAAVAKVTKTGGVVTPVATGKATIKVNAYKKSTGKFVKSFTLKLDVKQRATSVEIGAEDFELAVGETKDLNAVKTPATSTDTLRYFSSDEKVATVDVKTGLVKAVAAGEATIKVASKGAWFTSNTSKYNKYDTVKVTVVDGLLDVKQTAANKLSLTFSKDVSKTLKATDFAMEEVVSHAVQAVKGLSFSEDGKTVTLETYINFVDKKEYKLTYDEKAFNFTASVGEVASIVLKTDKVVFGEETAIKYALYDANGIDITSVVDDSRVTVDVDTKNGYTTDAGKKITLFNKGDVATVTVTYHTYTYENGAEKTVSIKGTIVAVDAKEISFGNYEAYTIAKSEPNWAKLATPNTKVAIGDNDYSIYLRVKNSADKYIAQSELTWKSSNGDVLLVNEVTGALYPVKEGSAYIIATTGKTSWTLPVNVVAKREATSVVIDKASVAVSNTTALHDKATILVTVKDQYGELFNSNVDSVVEVPSITAKAPSAVPSGASVIVDGYNAAKGAYTFLITAQGKKITFKVNVLEPTVGADTINKLLLSTNTVDTAITPITDLSTKTIKIVVGAYTGGVLNGQVTSTVKVTNPDKVETTLTAADGINYEFNPYATVSGSAIQKAKAGTYKVVATTADAKEYVSYFTITDTQALPTISVEKLTTDYADGLAAAKDTLKVKNADGKVLTIYKATTEIVGKSILIKDVTVVDTMPTHNGNVDVVTVINLGRTVYVK